MFGTTAEQIAAYHQEGKAVICYISAGSHEPNRPDSGDFLPECYCNKDDLCQLDGWPGEYWLDLHTPACIENVQSVMGKRIALAQVGMRLLGGVVVPLTSTVIDERMRWARAR